jgi:hypothetical protein
MHNLIFTTLSVPGKTELDTLLLAESIRTFGGRLKDNPIWVLVPADLGSLSDPTQEKLAQIDVQIIPFEADREIIKFPFAIKTLVAAYIEGLAQGQTERLVFMDRDTIVLGEPAEFLIPAGKALGYRPVHHQLIGSAWDQPLDTFWELVFEVCDVPEGRIFPMVTHAGERIRPYFNAGMYIVRPEKGLLYQWKDTFLKYYRDPRFDAYYQKDQIFAIFIHQAIFSGALLQALEPGETLQLSPRINYPLHLHEDIPLDQRPGRIDELVSVRYESIFDKACWEQLPFSKSLKSWLKSQPRLGNP